MSTLIVFGGLPGTGKTTLSREVARRCGAVYLRIDSIEQSIRATMPVEMGAAGYAVAMALARQNLSIGATLWSIQVQSGDRVITSPCSREKAQDRPSRGVTTQSVFGGLDLNFWRSSLAYGDL